MEKEDEKERKIATEQFVNCGGKMMRCGFTTGSAAAMAAMAAARAAATGTFPDYARIGTPKGWDAVAEIKKRAITGNMEAQCSVKKDAGDDPDATDGIEISAKVRLIPEERAGISVEITGGRGIGIVTKHGLEQEVGSPAINSVPRAMIEENVARVCAESSFTGKAEVEISAEDGEEIAKKTFNPHIGIIGGISILGTSGVVEPMSERALVDSIGVEMGVALSEAESRGLGRHIVVTPGNYGEDFLKKRPEFGGIPVVKCSNFIGKAIDFAVEKKAERVTFVGHAGKFVKVAGGIMDTHSHTADCRMEIIASHAALTSFDALDKSDMARILSCATTDAAFDILDETGATDATCRSIIRAAKKHIARRSGGAFRFDFLMFTTTRGLL